MMVASAHLQLAWHQVALFVQHHHGVPGVLHLHLRLVAVLVDVVLDVEVVLLGEGGRYDQQELAATQLTLGVAQQLVGGLWQ